MDSGVRIEVRELEQFSILFYIETKANGLIDGRAMKFPLGGLQALEGYATSEGVSDEFPKDTNYEDIKRQLQAMLMGKCGTGPAKPRGN